MYDSTTVNDYQTLVINTPLIQAYEQHIEQLTWDLATRDETVADISDQLKQRVIENEDLREELHSWVAEQQKMVDEYDLIPVGHEDGRPILKTPNEMVQLVEILKKDVETMEDEVIVLWQWNENLEKEVTNKREKFDTLTDKAEEF